MSGGFADLWKQAGEEEWEPPAGTYKVVIIDASGFESRAGNEIAKVQLEVTEGAFVGRSWTHIMAFSSAVSARISHGNLSVYGLNVSEITDWYELKEAMPRLIGMRAEVQVKHNGDYINTDVLRSFTGQSDVPADPALFETSPAGGRNAIKDDDDDVPY